jgi:hypothetical protein
MFERVNLVHFSVHVIKNNHVPRRRRVDHNAQSLKESVSQDNVFPLGRRFVKDDTEFLYDGKPYRK